MLDFTRYQCPPDGPLNAKIAMVGEAPGANEVAERRGFVGSSGKLLWLLAGEAGIAREECYVTNVVKNRPVGNDILLAEIPAFDTHWLALLQAELRQVAPNVVFALGGTALNALCNYDENFQRISNKDLSITSWRGSVLPCTLVPGLKVLSSLHPAGILRQWYTRVYLAADLRKLRTQSTFSDIRTRSQTIHIFPSFKQSIEFLGDITTEYATDVEIQNGELACVGFAPSNDEAMCIPITKRDLTSYWSAEEELEIWKAIGRRLNSPIPSIGQNYVFDLFWYIIYGCKPYLRQCYDTMLMSNLLNPELEKDLGTLTSIYTDFPFHKDEAKVWLPGAKVTDEAFFTYNGKDALRTREIKQAMEIDLKEAGLWNFYHTISMPLIACVLKPMVRGLRVDLKRQMTVYEEYQKQITELTTEFRRLVGKPDMNPNSTKQLAAYLYDEKGLKKQYNHKRKGVCVDEAVLEMFSNMYVLPELDILLEIREKTKTANTFLDPRRNDSDGRSRCSYNIPGTDSGRMSSSKGPLGSGGNLQNITHGLCRSIYIPDDGFVWLEGDTSQAEARIVAHIAPEPKLIELFNSGKDVHKFNAAIAFDVDYADVQKPQRFVAKHLVHAADYDVQAKTFAKTMNKKCKESKIDMHMTTQVAQEKLDKFHAFFPGIRVWHAKTQAWLAESPTLVNLFGRPHTFLDRIGPDVYRKAYNWQAQSVNADYLNVAWARFDERYPQYAVMMQIHDALMIQCRMQEVDRVKEALYKCFDITLEANGIKFKIPIEFKITETRWSEMRDA